MAVMDDIKAVKGYILGVIAFAAAIGTFGANTFGWDAKKVTAIALVAVFIAISLGVLVQRSESRNAERLKQHIDEANKIAKEDREALDYLKNMALENQRATIRLEMNSFIRNEPENHDTIIAYAERYFLELDGDWKQTDKFLSWIDSENEQGRRVHCPPDLLTNVNHKSALEKNTTQ